MRLLIVTAVEAERAAILSALPDRVTSGTARMADVARSGVGPATAAAVTSALLASADYDLVLCAGIGGGFAPLEPGAIAVAATIAFADLGAQTADGFLPAGSLGLGTDRYDVEPSLAVALAERTGGRLGTILTVATVTGTAATAQRLLGRYPDAVAEAMEGAGVAAAAVHHGIAFAEIRAISNAVGPRDRDGWRVSDALTALGAAVAAVVTAEWAP